MKYLILLFFISLSFNVFASSDKDDIKVIPSTFKGFLSLAKTAGYYEDVNQSVTIDSLLLYPEKYKFHNIGSDNKNVGFTSSAYWIKCKLKLDSGLPETYFLEVARPITNLAELYFPDKQGNYWMKRSGFSLNLNEKDVPHRNSLFKIPLFPENESTIYVKLYSGGDVLTLPLKLWTPDEFRIKDYHEQYILGFYYGMLALVIIVFLFFFFALKEKSFLYYVSFVVSIGLFEFTMDGFTTQFIFTENQWLGNRMVLLMASLSLIFVLLHAKVYLDVKNKLPYMNKVFNGFILGGLIILTASLTEGIIYKSVFPLINIISLFSTIVLVSAYILMLKNKIKVNFFYFMAFLFLISGAAIFILANMSLIHNNFFTDNALKLGSGFQVIFLSFATVGRYRSLQLEKELAQAATLEKLEEINKLQDSINIELEKQVKERTFKINKQKEVIELKNKDITDSINYAKKIQEAILPEENKLKASFPDSFILFKPKDIVSGDFYWISEMKKSKDQQKVFFAVADCTGHGVPGALMSMIGNSLLTQLVNEKNIDDPARILNYLRNGIIKVLNQSRHSGENKDGMDIALCSVQKINDDEFKLAYAGANNPLWILNPSAGAVNLLSETKADKQPIGIYQDEPKPFTSHSFVLPKGTMIFIFTDGYADQFGGPKGKKFKYNQLRELFISLRYKTMEEQKAIFSQTFENWKGNLEQVDDICLIGIRLI